MKRLNFQKSKCTGCQLCAQACSAFKEGEYIPSRARIFIASYYDANKELKHKDSFCNMCGICEENCPSSAISIQEYVSVDHDICTGCGTCERVCPKEVVRLRGKKSYICDNCKGDPVCAEICPTAALTF